MLCTSGYWHPSTNISTLTQPQQPSWGYDIVATGTQINPNQFEPYVSNTEESEAVDEDYEEERRDTLADSSWKLFSE